MTAEEIFWLAHTGLPREAPGSDVTTRLLLRLAGAAAAYLARLRELADAAGLGHRIKALQALSAGHRAASASESSCAPPEG